MSAHLAQAAEWRLLSLLFEYPDEAWRRRIAALSPDLKDPALSRLAEAALELAAEGMHTALFGPGGSVPVREAAYLGGVQFGYLMSELAACYQAFGYRPATDEADDHLAVEAGFLAYLKLKQAYAEAAGDAEHAAITAETAERFLKEHLAVMAQPVAAALEAFAPDYLVEAGRILVERAGPPPRSNYPLGGAAPADDDEDITCGAAAGEGELIQLG